MNREGVSTKNNPVIIKKKKLLVIGQMQLFLLFYLIIFLIFFFFFFFTPFFLPCLCFVWICLFCQCAHKLRRNNFLVRTLPLKMDDVCMSSITLASIRTVCHRWWWRSCVYLIMQLNNVTKQKEKIPCYKLSTMKLTSKKKCYFLKID